MPSFMVVTLALVLIAAVFLLMPIMMNRSVAKITRQNSNVDAFKDRFAELESDHQNQLVGDDEFVQLKTELQRRLLDEAEIDNAGNQQEQNMPKKAAVFLALLIPVFAAFVYYHTGAKSDWDITETLKDVRHKAAAGESSDTEVDKLLGQIESRLAQRPDDPHYLMLLASTHMERQNYPAAADAYQRLSASAPDDPTVLARYAQALYLASGRQLTAAIQDIADKALAINPQQPTILGMLGIASFEEGSFQQAIDYWQQLLPMLGPVSPNRQMITAGIEQARAKLAEQGVVIEEPSAPATVATAASIEVAVSIDDDIKADRNAVVFVFARAAAGPRMPLAVARLSVADLPANIVLDDSMAMAPGLNLSSFNEVEVVARISKNGIANPGPGDIEGRLGPITVAAASGVLPLLIDQVVR